MSFDEEIKIKAWVETMDEEIEAIEKNGSSELVDRPQGKNAISVKWI